MRNRHLLKIVCLMASMTIFGFLQPVYALTDAQTSQVDPERGGNLTLADCIAAALENNPDLKAVHNEAGAASADREIAEGNRWPSIRVKGGASRYLDDQRLTPARYNGEKGVFGQDMADIGLSLKMPIFTGGRIVNTIRAAKLTETAAIDRFNRSRQELMFNVTSVFYTILGRRRQLESIEFSRDVLKKDRLRIQALIEAEKAARADLLRLDVRLAQVEESWVRVSNDIHAAWRVLYNFMGIQTDVGQKPPELEGALEPTPPVPDGKTAFETALRQRPDFQAASARTEAQARRVDAARGKHWPQINLEGFYGWRTAGNPSDRPDGTDTTEDRGVVGLTLDIPVFEGGRIQAEVRRETEKLSALRQKQHSLKLRIQKEVETALSNMASARQRIRTQKTATSQAEEALRIEQEKYRLGKGAILDVLDAQRALLEIETEYSRALAQYHIAVGQFRLAAGELS